MKFNGVVLPHFDDLAAATTTEVASTLATTAAATTAAATTVSDLASNDETSNGGYYEYRIPESWGGQCNMYIKTTVPEDTTSWNMKITFSKTISSITAWHSGVSGSGTTWTMTVGHVGFYIFLLLSFSIIFNRFCF